MLMRWRCIVILISKIVNGFGIHIRWASNFSHVIALIWYYFIFACSVAEKSYLCCSYEAATITKQENQLSHQPKKKCNSWCGETLQQQQSQQRLWMSDVLGKEATIMRNELKVKLNGKEGKKWQISLNLTLYVWDTLGIARRFFFVLCSDTKKYFHVQCAFTSFHM